MFAAMPLTGLRCSGPEHGRSLDIGLIALARAGDSSSSIVRAYHSPWAAPANGGKAGKSEPVAPSRHYRHRSAHRRGAFAVPALARKPPRQSARRAGCGVDEPALPCSVPEHFDITAREGAVPDTGDGAAASAEALPRLYTMVCSRATLADMGSEAMTQRRGTPGRRLVRAGDAPSRQRAVERFALSGGHCAPRSAPEQWRFP
jgi:hypothetical protein